MDQERVQLPPLVHEEPFVSRQSLVGDFHNRTASLHPGYDFGSHGTVEDLARFGLDIIGYFQESCHQGWEGFNEDFRLMSSVYRLFADIEAALQALESPQDIAHKNRTLEHIRKHPYGRDHEWQQLDLFNQQA